MPTLGYNWGCTVICFHLRYFSELPCRGLVGEYIKFVMFILTAGPRWALHDHRYIEQYLYPLRCPLDKRRLEEVGACQCLTNLCAWLGACNHLQSCDSQVIASTSHISICPLMYTLTYSMATLASHKMPSYKAVFKEVGGNARTLVSFPLCHWNTHVHGILDGVSFDSFCNRGAISLVREGVDLEWVGFSNSVFSFPGNS